VLDLTVRTVAAFERVNTLSPIISHPTSAVVTVVIAVQCAGTFAAAR